MTPSPPRMMMVCLHCGAAYYNNSGRKTRCSNSGARWRCGRLLQPMPREEAWATIKAIRAAILTMPCYRLPCAEHPSRIQHQQIFPGGVRS